MEVDIDTRGLAFDDAHALSADHDVYDRLEPFLLGDVLRSAAGFVGGMAASVYFRSTATTPAPRACVRYRAALSAPLLRQIRKVRSDLDRYFFAEIERPCRPDIMPYDEFCNTLLPEWVALKAWWIRPTYARQVGDERRCFVSFATNATGSSTRDARRMRLIAPHVAARRSLPPDRSEDGGAATFAEVLDRWLRRVSRRAGAQSFMPMRSPRDPRGRQFLPGVDVRLVAADLQTNEPCARCSPRRRGRPPSRRGIAVADARTGSAICPRAAADVGCHGAARHDYAAVAAVFFARRR